MTRYVARELNDHVKARLDRADGADCYIDESGDICLVGDEPFADLTGLTEIEDADAQALLDAARAAQTAYWDALLELESALGVEIDQNLDLEDATIESLKETA